MIASVSREKNSLTRSNKLINDNLTASNLDDFEAASDPTPATPVGEGADFGSTATTAPDSTAPGEAGALPRMARSIPLDDGAYADSGPGVPKKLDHGVINVNRKPENVTRNAPNTLEDVIRIATVEPEENNITFGKNGITNLRSGFKMGHAGIHRISEPEVNAGQDHDPLAARSNSTTGDYRVQIGAYRSRIAAHRGKEMFARMAPDLLRHVETIVKVNKRGASDRINYRLRTAPSDSRGAADDLCRNLTSKGISCLVIKHNPNLWNNA
jgi:hypothetical protein